MGSCNVSTYVSGDKSRQDIRQHIQNLRSENRDYNGHQEGYSGDWQTIDQINFSDKIFNTEEEAHEYALDNTKKWEGMAVRYKQIKEVKPSAQLKKVQKAILALETKRLKLKENYLKFAKAAWVKRAPVLAKRKTFKCGSCKSTLNMKFVEASNSGSIETYYTCPVCERGLLLPAQLKRANALRKAIAKIEEQIKAKQEKSVIIKAKLIEKIAAKTTKTGWLIVGWAAC